MSFILADNISKTFVTKTGQKVPAIANATLSVNCNEFV